MNSDLSPEATQLAELNGVQSEETVQDSSSQPREPAAEITIESNETRLGVEVALNVAGVKSAALLADSRPPPAEDEGLLLNHHEFPLGAEIELAMTADDHEVFRERFILPTHRRAEVIEAHQHLAGVSEQFVIDAHQRDLAMGIYFPNLVEEVDIWYHVKVNEHRLLTYAVHTGPAHHQEVKKIIEGTLQL